MKPLKSLLLLLTFLSFSILQAQKVIPLYEGKAPGSEDWTWSEQISTSNQFQTQAVYNVVSPTLTAYLPPKTAANG
ncbi:MAG: G-D-S-L family lipolytic protein, partial [Bacteroidetes bacterium]|nr:G-D-S-L family lipolytic protein [Bacteroidota bacterium]